MTHYFKNIVLEYHSLTEVFRSRIEKFILRNCPEGKMISFEPTVYGHFIDDNVYTDIRTVNRDLLFTYNRCAFGEVDAFISGLEEWDLSALYEIALALEEESFKLVDL